MTNQYDDNRPLSQRGKDAPPTTATRPDEIILTSRQFLTLLNAAIAAYEANIVTNRDEIERVIAEIREHSHSVDPEGET
jgi:hypothetical protein